MEEQEITTKNSRNRLIHNPRFSWVAFPLANLHHQCQQLGGCLKDRNNN